MAIAGKTDSNPFKPGAGHSPPFLAGREREAEEFAKLLNQDVVLQNVVLTGLRGVGKTVLMDTVYKPLALSKNWVWVGSDFSESAFVDERTLCNRLLLDLSLFTSQIRVGDSTSGWIHATRSKDRSLSFGTLVDYFEAQNGLVSDRLKATLEFVWSIVKKIGRHGIVFAYDEAQVVHDRPEKDQHPLALLLETFQSLERKGMRYMLLLTGLPTLFPKLVESRTYAERMFVVQDIGRLDHEACCQAITKPLENNAINFSKTSVDLIVDSSKCYPYFIQFICREAYDYFKTVIDRKPSVQSSALPVETLVRKLDTDFFAGRWGKITDRQRELLLCIACLKNSAEEFTVNDIRDISREAAAKHKIKPFKPGDISQMMPKVIEAGLIYRNRHGKYCLAVPLFDAFIRRQFADKERMPGLFDSIP